MGRWLLTLLTGFLVCVAMRGETQAQSSIHAGVSIPVGDFALADSVYGGYAQTGISVSIETHKKSIFGSEIGVSALLSYHPVDGDAVLRTHRNIFAGSRLDPGSWFLLWPMMSLGYTVRLSSDVSVYGKGLGGILFGASPDMTVISGGVAFTQNMALVISGSYGASAGIQVGRFDLNGQYLFARPEYDINIQGQGTSTAGRSLYVTTTFQVLLGYRI
jgi:hypothetical protein